MEKTERCEKLEEESHEACLPRVLSKSYSWGQKDEQRSTDFIDYRGRKRLPGRLAGCITKESKDQSQAKWVSVSRDGGSWSKNLVMSEPEMQKARQMRQLNSQLRSPTVLGYKEDKPCCGHSPGGTIPPPCTSNIFKNRGALSNQKETVCKEQREAEENIQKTNPWASLMVQWFPVQETRVLFLVKELDCPHCN